VRELPVDAARQQIDLEALIKMPGVPNGMGAVLLCNAGMPHCPEVYAYGNDRWDGVYDGFRNRTTAQIADLMKALFAKRRAPWRWVALVPAAVGLVFSGMALDDGGHLSALPYIAVILLSLLYIVRPMFALWAPAFAAFLVYSVLVLVAPLVAPGNLPLSDWIIFSFLGIVPAGLLWLARPKPEA
jgi:hypothetical protein